MAGFFWLETHVYLIIYQFINYLSNGVSSASRGGYNTRVAADRLSYRSRIFRVAGQIELGRAGLNPAYE